MCTTLRIGTTSAVDVRRLKVSQSAIVVSRGTGSGPLPFHASFAWKTRPVAREPVVGFTARQSDSMTGIGG